MKRLIQFIKDIRSIQTYKKDLVLRERALAAWLEFYREYDNTVCPDLRHRASLLDHAIEKTSLCNVDNRLFIYYSSVLDEASNTLNDRTGH